MRLFALPRLWPAAWAVAAAFVGLAVAALPLELAGPALAALALALAAVWEPALGLGLALALGPARAYLSVARPDLPGDLGQVFFALALAGWLGRGLVQRRLAWPRHPLWLPLGAYLAVCALSLLAAASLEEGLKEVLKWLQVLLAVAIVVTEAERGRLPWLVAAVLAAGAGQALLGLWQFELRGTGPDHFRIAGGNFRAYGTFEQPNPYGGFLGLVWPLAAGVAAELGWQALRRLWPGRRPGWRPLALAAGAALALAGLMLAGLYASYSRGAWLGAAAAALVLVVAWPRRWWAGLALLIFGLAAAGALYAANLLPAGVTARLGDVTDFIAVTDVTGADITVENFAIVERLAHWQAAQGMARDYPWLGVGVGNYAAAYPRYRLFNWAEPLGHAHMIYLNVLAETGVLGLAAYLGLWIAVVTLTLRARARAAGLERGLALGLLGAWAHLSAHQVVDNLYVNNLHFTLAALLGLAVCLSRLPSPADGPGPRRLAALP
jgi:O-antigen ligase